MRETRGAGRRGAAAGALARACAFAAGALALVGPREAGAWVLSEHAQITARALASVRGGPETTDAMRGVLVDVGRELGLAPDGTPGRPSLAYLPALAGDHSCSPAELGRFLREPAQRRWVEGVVAVGDATAKALARAGLGDETRAQIRRGMHVDLQAADDDYVARAAVDYSHFQLSREAGPLTLRAYLSFAFAAGQQANATASYANYHVAALRLAGEARRSGGAERADRLVRALLAEAFALHFLEDSFAAGHFVGHWGYESVRIGTHDYYSGFGAEAMTWAGLERTPSAFGAAPYRARGDAFLGDVDLRRASAAVAASVTQVLRAATDAGAEGRLLGPLAGVLGAEAYDACTSASVPPGLGPLAEAAPVRAVLAEEPVPSPREPAPPRARVEKGAFVGAAAAFEAGLADPRSVAPAGAGALIGRVRGTLRLGLGLAGIVEDPMNAQAFVDAGFVGASLGPFRDAHASVSGWTVRLRSPGVVVGLDGVIGALGAQLARSPFTLAWASRAGNGGLGHLWKSHRLAGPVTWQLSALRDMSYSVYANEPGRGQSRHEFAYPIFSARHAFPMAGVAPGQSVDLWLDLGGMTTWSSQHPGAAHGAYLAFSMASRVFPAGLFD